MPILYHNMVHSTGIEPVSPAPQANVLSVERRVLNKLLKLRFYTTYKVFLGYFTNYLTPTIYNK